MRILIVFLITLFATSARAQAPHIAVALTFDLDAETLWWDDPATMTGNPNSLSQGQYGPKVALPKILALLQQHNIHATFFIPAWVAEHYPDSIQLITAAGHEIGAHGVRHVSPSLLSPKEERKEFAESIRILEDQVGKRPVGYRAPSWSLSPVTLKLAAEAGFTYSSNLADADAPYVNKSNGLVELPVSWTLDDAPFFWFDEDSWDKKIHSAADVEAIWREEFQAAYKSGGYFNLTMHPQIIGRPARIAMLEKFITWMQSLEGVEFATCGEIAAQTRTNADFRSKKKL